MTGSSRFSSRTNVLLVLLGWVAGVGVALWLGAGIAAPVLALAVTIVAIREVTRPADPWPWWKALSYVGVAYAALLLVRV
jgi:hypothetical protein